MWPVILASVGLARGHFRTATTVCHRLTNFPGLNPAVLARTRQLRTFADTAGAMASVCRGGKEHLAEGEVIPNSSWCSIAKIDGNVVSEELQQTVAAMFSHQIREHL
jgi:hypothetical protein